MLKKKNEGCCKRYGNKEFYSQSVDWKYEHYKLAQIENGDSTTLNHCLAICQLQKYWKLPDTWDLVWLLSFLIPNLFEKPNF